MSVSGFIPYDSYFEFGVSVSVTFKPREFDLTDLRRAW